MSNPIHVNPNSCRMWDMHDRLAEELTTASCASLIRSIQKNKQRHPVLGRRLPHYDEYEIELIYGARRLFATRHLGIPLLVDIRDLTDREALVEMDIENRVRSDISPYERGLSYRQWLREGYFESQSELARSLRISEAQVSRLLRFADLPTAIVSAFRSPCNIREEWAVSLAQRCREEKSRQAVIARARRISQSQQTMPPQKVYDTLVNHGSTAAVHARPRDSVIRDSNGKPIMRVSLKTKAVHFIVQREKVTSAVLSSITERITETLDTAGEPHPADRHEPRRRSSSPADVNRLLDMDATEPGTSGTDAHCRLPPIVRYSGA